MSTLPVALLLGSFAAAICGDAAQQPPIVQPGAPGSPSRTITATEAMKSRPPGFTDADVKFMQGMIGHHQQAIDMVELLRARTDDAAMKKLGLRIGVSQADEIKMMQRWLQDRGQPAPAEHAMHMPGATLMPGMLTAEAMKRLAAARGREFDRLFLEGMIRHHQGALQMVKDLFATRGAGQESDIFAFASDVEADQRMEIDRMATMLKELQK